MDNRGKKTTVSAILIASIGLMGCTLLTIAADPKPEIEELRAGKNFIPTKVYTAEDDQQILKLFAGLRVADVSDGMDKVGLTNTGLMSP